MKIFDSTNTPGAWGGKWNFVDDNNGVVGYDRGANCCEFFGYSITVSKFDTSEEVPTAEELVPYSFCTSHPPEFEDGMDKYDEGGAVSFKLVADGKPDLWLTLFNMQNGYYSHGWDATIGGSSESGCL